MTFFFSIVREYDESAGDYECVTVLSDHTADVKSVRWLPTKDVLVSARRVTVRGVLIVMHAVVLAR